jgi:hypothetical protein
MPRNSLAKEIVRNAASHGQVQQLSAIEASAPATSLDGTVNGERERARGTNGGDLAEHVAGLNFKWHEPSFCTLHDANSSERERCGSDCGARGSSPVRSTETHRQCWSESVAQWTGRRLERAIAALDDGHRTQ